MKKKDILKKVIRKTATTIVEHSLIKNGDNIFIAFSGGKDSVVLTDVLLNLKKNTPIDFSLSLIHIGDENIASTMEQFPIKSYIFPHIMPENRDSKDGVCPICARVRRGILTKQVIELGGNKIMLGHHLDDVIETLLLNQFYQAKRFTMRISYKNDLGVDIIRALHSVLESDIQNYLDEKGLKIYEKSCPYDANKNLERLEIKKTLSSFSSPAKYNFYYSNRDLYL
ncbi:hypothetical protein JXR93_00895 [bacterium]|nr:hypothetical protein [bacterium]